MWAIKNFFTFSFLADPVLLQTTTTRTILPPWFPQTPDTLRPSFEKTLENNTVSGLKKNGSSLHDDIDDSVLTKQVTTDCPNPEHNDCGNSHWVKVPEVPYDYQYIKNNSKQYFPIVLPTDNNEDDTDFEQSTPASTTPKKPTVSIQVLPNFTQYCPPARSRNLFWNWTLAVRFFFFFLKPINQ